MRSARQTSSKRVSWQWRRQVSELQVQTINVVFDGPPSHESGRFIEVENLDGASIKAGEWVQLDSERWALQLDVVTIK